jgi:hypothetical protein
MNTRGPRKGTAKEIAGQARLAVARRRRDPAQVAKGIAQAGEGQVQKRPAQSKARPK